MAAFERHALSQRLESIFSRLREYGIFGTDIFGGDWPPSEGFDLAAGAVPTSQSREWGWRSHSEMSLCWVDVWRARDWEADYDGERDWGTEHIEFLKSAADPPSIRCYYDGSNDEDRLRIANAIVDAASEIGLIADWNGDIGQAIRLSVA